MRVCTFFHIKCRAFGMVTIFFWKSFSIKEFLRYNLYYKWQSQLCLNTSTFPSFKNHWPSMIWTFNYENKQENKLNIICFAYSHHLALKFPKKIFVVPIFVQELKELQYTKRNDPKSVFPRPDQIDPYKCTNVCSAITFLRTPSTFH